MRRRVRDVHNGADPRVSIRVLRSVNGESHREQRDPPPCPCAARTFEKWLVSGLKVRPFSRAVSDIQLCPSGSKVVCRRGGPLRTNSHEKRGAANPPSTPPLPRVFHPSSKWWE